ncbi:MAG: hypothetical protein GF384_03050, partial [Elusimicrobia bacterium]|nr:hypothetical protein [Elusimicrobiota bacterium]MBD3411914.1 hypothetical protein [Elusimicrobiota bacterium]
MKGIVCKVCGYVALDGKAPEKCPACGAPKKSFEEKEDALKTSSDEKELGEKHVPVIKVIKTCGLIPDGCTDVQVKIGSTIHPMKQE